MASLETLDLSYNSLSGHIPHELGNLSELTYLSLEENEFSGQLPNGLGTLKQLNYFWIHSNNLIGELPDSYDQLTSLVLFSIGGNNMSGRIPKFIEKWTSLDTLKLIGNNFEGRLHPEIFMLSSLRYLWISDLSVPAGFDFPKSANLSNIVSLILRNCSIRGQIPDYIGNNMSSLDHLDLSFNNLTGAIPSSISRLNLTTMNFAWNKLHESIPDWIPALIKRCKTRVDLSHNNFTGVPFRERSIPDMDFSHNNFTIVPFRERRIPDMNLFECCSASIQDVNSSTQITKQFCPGNKSKYRSLYINCGGEDKFINETHYDGDNKTSSFYLSPQKNWAYSCSGDFLSDNVDPSDFVKNMTCDGGISVTDAPLHATARLCPVSLMYYGFCLHEGNYTVKLHFAEIVYSKNEDYSSLGERVFDVYIQGNRVLKDLNIKDKARIPNKEWTIEFNTFVEKEDHMLTIHFFWAGKGSFSGLLYRNGPLVSAISVTPNFKVRGNALSPLHITLIAVASVVFALFLISLFVWKIGWLRGKKFPDEEKRIELPGGSVSVRQIIDATNNFSSKNEIGRGGFGTVYKAELQSQIVAVKKLSAQSKQGIEEFKTEVYSLSLLKHENLVQFFGGYSGNGLHLLIYEYMEHNSIAHALFDSESHVELDWKTRCEICLGIAKGLRYLHEESRIKIFHRDIKANNILLDRTLKAKISDFGLARLCEKGEENMVSRVAGTHGYMAPEYAMRGIFTDKSDVYSFGVLLLEIVSGKNNSEYKPAQETVFLLDTAYVLHKEGRLIDLVDKRLSANYNALQAITILNLGMMCTSQTPTLRPTMSEVVSVLEGERTVEQVSDTGLTAPTVGASRTMAGGYFNSPTEISYSSTEVPSTSSTSYFIIKERDETKHSSVDPEPA